MLKVCDLRRNFEDIFGDSCSTNGILLGTLKPAVQPTQIEELFFELLPPICSIVSYFFSSRTWRFVRSQVPYLTGSPSGSSHQLC